jgi:hypothetical protein
MTNDQAPMTKQTANYNDQWRAGRWALPFRFRFIGHCLGLGHCFWLMGHWCLVIGACLLRTPHWKGQEE